VTAPFWQRFQIEIGGRWQLLPNKDLTWAKWAWDPFGSCIWPGKRVTYGATPDGCWSGVWSRAETYDSETRSAQMNFYWLSGAIRILGLDFGAAILYRPNT
jgi:hypothetical protein